ncbi:MAG TPA: hypothetical protein VF911_00855 [Thermoanaerobaculia bacterium]|jgi:hypothetical protein
MTAFWLGIIASVSLTVCAVASMRTYAHSEGAAKSRGLFLTCAAATLIIHSIAADSGLLLRGVEGISGFVVAIGAGVHLQPLVARAARRRAERSSSTHAAPEQSAPTLMSIATD